MFTEIILLKKEMHLIKTFLTLLISLYIFLIFLTLYLKRLLDGVQEDATFMKK